jgi:uncharacterized protein YuzE
MVSLEQFEPEKGEICYDKRKDVLYVSFYDTEKGKWVSLTIEDLKSKSKYFPEDDTLWVDIVDKSSCESEYFSGGFVVDFDESGEPVGLEIFGWKKFFDTERNRK